MSCEEGEVRIKSEPASPPPAATPRLYVRHRSSYVRTKTLKNTYVCEVCNVDLGSHSKLQVHKLCHFNTSHICYVCDSYFALVETLIMHVASAHQDLNPANLTNDPELFVCSICLQRFSSKASFIKHQNQHTTMDKAKFGCRICGLDFNGASSVVSHLETERHNEMKVKIQSIFVCVDCRYVFASRDAYAMHMMLRAQNESCDGMEGAVDRAAQVTRVLQLLQNTSRDDSPLNLTNVQRKTSHECPSCMLVFPNEYSLTLHMKTHDSDSGVSTSMKSPWTCSTCSVAFYSCDALAMHMMTQHSGSSQNKQPTTTTHEPRSESADAVLAGRQDDGNESPLIKRRRPHSAIDLQTPTTHYVWQCEHCKVALHSRSEWVTHLMKCTTGALTEEVACPQEPRKSETPVAGTVSQSGIAASNDSDDGDVVDYVLQHANHLAMCKYCKIIYTDKTLYYLHMGLHNLNNPWQCNMCGKTCADLHEFTSHVIHYN